MTDKVKGGAVDLFAKTKTFAFRATQKAMVKLGKAEETIDIQFNQEFDRFVLHRANIKKIKKDTIQMLQLMRDLSVQQCALADTLGQMFDARSANYSLTLKTQDISKQLDHGRTTFDDVMKKDFLDPMSKYLGQFKECKLRIEERRARLIDMDRYGRDLRSLQEKATGGQKTQIAEQKYDAAATNYHNLNDELLQDLPRLFDDRISFFDPLLATYGVGLAEYYRHCAQTSGDIVNLARHINRDAIHSHTRVTTSPEASAAAHKVSVGAATSTTNYRASTQVSSQHYEEPNRTQMSQPVVQQDPFVDQNSGPFQDPNQRYPSVNSQQPRKSVPTLPSHKQARAMFDFVAQEVNELPFKTGDIITIHNTNGDWWEGEMNGKRGLLPSNYVQLI